MLFRSASVALNSQKITGLATPTANGDAANKSYVDTQVTNLVNSAPAALDTLNELATALGNDANFSTTVTNSLAGKLSLSGGTMTGAIAMGSSKITGLGTPTATGDAATKDYADTKLALSGGTMTGAIAMGTNKITGLGDPTSAQDAATKNYIDTAVLAPSNLTGVITSVGNLTSIASQTGTGSTFVVQNSPTLTTPNIGVATATSINGTTIPSSKTLVATDSTQYVVPSQTGNSGKYLTTDGTVSSWGTVSSYTAPTLGSTTISSGSTVTNVNGLTINSTTIPTSKTLVATDSTAYVVPSQTGNSGKYLTTDGTTSSWGTVQSGSQVKLNGGAAATYTYIDFVGMGTDTGTAGTVKISPANVTDGKVGKNIFVGTTTPTSPSNGDIWIDESVDGDPDLRTMNIMGAY